MLISVLEKAKVNGKIISLYSNVNSTEKFTVGRVVELLDGYIIIESYAPNGAYDGFIIKELKSVYRVDFDSEYLQKIIYLNSLHYDGHTPFVINGESLIKNFLNYAQKNNLVISVELFESNLNDVQGFVKEIDNDFMTIEKINEYGAFDGISTICLENITFMVCDSEEEQIIKKLSSQFHDK